MATAQHTVSIDCGIDTVFDFLADGTNNPQWRTGVIEISTTAPTPAVGTTYRQVMSGPAGDASTATTASSPSTALTE
jgi:hypothetical protein